MLLTGASGENPIVWREGSDVEASCYLAPLFVSNGETK